jgi:hypothetical protein
MGRRHNPDERCACGAPARVKHQCKRCYQRVYARVHWKPRYLPTIRSFKPEEVLAIFVDCFHVTAEDLAMVIQETGYRVWGKGYDPSLNYRRGDDNRCRNRWTM